MPICACGKKDIIPKKQVEITGNVGSAEANAKRINRSYAQKSYIVKQLKQS